MSVLIEKWKKTTTEVLISFLTKYFELDDTDICKDDYFWVANEIGSICYFADFYINFSDMVYCLENDVPINKFFEWYDWCLEHDGLNLKSFLMGEKAVKEQEIKHLDELRKRVERAEEELIEAIRKYGDKNSN